VKHRFGTTLKSGFQQFLKGCVKALKKKKGKGRGKYAYIAIPEDLAKIIDAIVENAKYGYRSRAEFVTDAIRRRLEELGYLK